MHYARSSLSSYVLKPPIASSFHPSPFLFIRRDKTARVNASIHLHRTSNILPSFLPSFLSCFLSLTTVTFCLTSTLAILLISLAPSLCTSHSVFLFLSRFLPSPSLPLALSSSFLFRPSYPSLFVPLFIVCTSRDAQAHYTRKLYVCFMLCCSSYTYSYIHICD